jgi:hypothetical protein
LDVRTPPFLQYDSLEAAIAATVAVYEEVLARLVSDRGLEVFAHPVPPVLGATRGVVSAFNAALRATVVRLRGAGGPGERGGGSSGGRDAGAVAGWRSRVHWLEFADELLETAGPAAGGAEAGGSHEGAGGSGCTGGCGLRLRREFELDGTHLAPAYLRLLQRALDSAAPAG